MSSYPCLYLTPVEALSLWRLAEESFTESDSADEQPSLGSADSPAELRLRDAVDSLTSDAYQDAVALMWLGRSLQEGENTRSYSQLREDAEAEEDRGYLVGTVGELHSYFRTALEQSGLTPIHTVDPCKYN